MNHDRRAAVSVPQSPESQSPEIHSPEAGRLEPQPADPAVDQASAEYVGRWNRLVSTTNWEKGKVICQWRAALIESGAPATEYSDEAWARRVGGVTGQHVGRLRRVHERFGDSYGEFEGLYWSHFQAALEWDDAEMWLQGAVNSGWSVAQMRDQRWETMGALEADKPQPADVVSAELDEDFEPAREQPPGGKVSESYDRVQDPGKEDPPASTAPEAPSSESISEPVADASGVEAAEPAPLVRPFENLPELPDDVTEAFESFKLALLRHKADGWREISRDDLLSALEALKQLALAPSSEESGAPF